MYALRGKIFVNEITTFILGAFALPVLFYLCLRDPFSMSNGVIRTFIFYRSIPIMQMTMKVIVADCVFKRVHGSNVITSGLLV